MSNRTFVSGDWYGEYDKVMKCLESVNFADSDTLIQLGDVVDRGKDSYRCIELLLSIKNLISIKGNHDDWWFTYLKTYTHPSGFHHGGIATLDSYLNEEINPEIHFDFFAKQRPYYIDENNNLFIHGGYNRHHLIEEQKDTEVFWWDRDLLHSARSHQLIFDKNSELLGTKDTEIKFANKNRFKEIFVGHTPVQYFNVTTPQKYANIWDLDCGAGKFKDGTVCIMDVNTKEYKQF